MKVLFDRPQAAKKAKNDSQLFQVMNRSVQQELRLQCPNQHGVEPQLLQRLCEGYHGNEDVEGGKRMDQQVHSQKHQVQEMKVVHSQVPLTPLLRLRFNPLHNLRYDFHKANYPGLCLASLKSFLNQQDVVFHL